jgi:hypothetical protein
MGAKLVEPLGLEGVSCTHVATLDVSGLQGLSYVGMIGLCGNRLADDPETWML